MINVFQQRGYNIFTIVLQIQYVLKCGHQFISQSRIQPGKATGELRLNDCNVIRVMFNLWSKDVFGVLGLSFSHKSVTSGPTK